MSPVAIAVTLVAAERLTEVALCWRNRRALAQQGAVETPEPHYPAIIALHTLWLLSLLVFVPASTTPYPIAVALYLALQVVRAWSIWSLGRFWTTRVVTLPGAPLVRTGPYRFVRHPIYVIVISEIALLPIAFGAWAIAAVFTLANLVLLSLRVRAEDAALAPRRA